MLQIANAAGPQGSSAARNKEQPAANPLALAAEPAVAPKAAKGFLNELNELAKIEADSLESEDASPEESGDMESGSEPLATKPSEQPRDPVQLETAQLSLLEAVEQMLRGVTISSQATTSPQAPASPQATVGAQTTDSEPVSAVMAPLVDPQQREAQGEIEDEDMGAILRRASGGAARQTAESMPSALRSVVHDAASVGDRNSAVVAADPAVIELENVKGLASASGPSAPGTSSVHGSSLAVPASHTPVLEQSLKLQGPEAKWGEQMLHSLRESVDLQVQQRMQSATIRLDPPELGSMEILLKHEAGHLTVHINAAQVDVARLLQQLSERLRQELIEQDFAQVSVEVSSDGESEQQQSKQRRRQVLGEEPVMNAQPGAAPHKDKAARTSDVLITV